MGYFMEMILNNIHRKLNRNRNRLVRTVVTGTAVIFYTQSQIAGSLLCVQTQHFNIMRVLEIVYT
jgi:hypothetical protein